MGGQEEWEGRRSERAGGVGGQEEWESMRNGGAGGEEGRTHRTYITQRTNKRCNHLVSSLT